MFLQNNFKIPGKICLIETKGEKENWIATEKEYLRGK